MACLALGIMTGLTNSQRIKYSQAISIFKRVEAYNANILMLRRAGDSTKTYYEFVSTDEQSQYTLGRFLLNQNDSKFTTYIPVEKI